MISLKNHVEQNFRDIFRKYDFVLCEEEQSYENIGNAYIIYGNKELKLLFVRDRDQIFLDLCSLFDFKKNNWFSIGLIRNEILNEGYFLDLLSNENISFVNDNFELIIEMFSQANIESTINKLKLQSQVRANKLFK